MKITKIGHSCLLVEEKGLRILIDPGEFTVAQNGLEKLDIILITQEHQDHFDINSVKKILSGNSAAKVMTNRGVAKHLEGSKIQHSLLEDGQSVFYKGVLIEAFGNKHGEIYPTITPIANTGYLIDGKFFDPGDALTNPDKTVEILALPIEGPWLKLSEAIDYAKKVKPKICFPVHDGLLKITEPFYRITKGVLEPEGIKFIVIEDGQTMEF